MHVFNRKYHISTGRMRRPYVCVLMKTQLTNDRNKRFSTDQQRKEKKHFYRFLLLFVVVVVFGGRGWGGGGGGGREGGHVPHNACNYQHYTVH